MINENVFYERYEIGRELGRGNHGVTYLIQDRETKHYWAAKFIERGPRVYLLPPSQIGPPIHHHQSTTTTTHTPAYVPARPHARLPAGSMLAPAKGCNKACTTRC